MISNAYLGGMLAALYLCGLVKMELLTKVILGNSKNNNTNNFGSLTAAQQYENSCYLVVFMKNGNVGLNGFSTTVA